MKSTFVQVRPVALMPDEPSIDRDTEWRKFDIHKNSLASAGKSQARFVATLLAFLALLWGWHYMQPTELSLEFFGARMHAAGLWTIAPAVLTVLVLALIGAMNIMGPIWKRLRICTDRLHEIFFWTDLDPNKTLLDFFTHLKVWPEGAVEAYTVPREEKAPSDCRVLISRVDDVCDIHHSRRRQSGRIPLVQAVRVRMRGCSSSFLVSRLVSCYVPIFRMAKGASRNLNRFSDNPLKLLSMMSARSAARKVATFLPSKFKCDSYDGRPLRLLD